MSSSSSSSCLRHYSLALVQLLGLVVLRVIADELTVIEAEISAIPQQGRLGSILHLQCLVKCSSFMNSGSGCPHDCGVNVDFFHAVGRDPATMFTSMKRVNHENSTRFKMLNVTQVLHLQSCQGVKVVLQINELLLEDGGFYECRRPSSRSNLLYLTVYGELNVSNANVPVVHSPTTLMVNSREFTFNSTSMAEKANVTINCSLVLSSQQHSESSGGIAPQSPSTASASTSSMLLQSAALVAKGSAFFLWYRQNESVPLDSRFQTNIKIANWSEGVWFHSSLTFAPLRKEDVGAYICSVISSAGERLVSGLVNVFTVPLTNIKVQLNGKEIAAQSAEINVDVAAKKVSEGLTIRPFKDDNVSLLCDVVAHPSAQLVWWWSQTDALLGVQSADSRWLHLGRLNFSHRATYFCNASSAQHLNSMAGVRLRVRDPRAAYWPLIGIGLEVLIMLFITIFFELC